MTTNSVLKQMAKNVARNAAKMRAVAGIGFSDLADITGISQSTLRRIDQSKQMNQTYNPMLRTVVKLSDVAGVSVDDFLTTKLKFS